MSPQWSDSNGKSQARMVVQGQIGSLIPSQPSLLPPPTPIQRPLPRPTLHLQQQRVTLGGPCWICTLMSPAHLRLQDQTCHWDLQNGATTGGASTLLTLGMTAAEVMASLGRGVNSLEQLHRQQLEQQRIGCQFLHLTLVNGVHTGRESAGNKFFFFLPRHVHRILMIFL